MLVHTNSKIVVTAWANKRYNLRDARGAGRHRIFPFVSPGDFLNKMIFVPTFSWFGRNCIIFYLAPSIFEKSWAHNEKHSSMPSHGHEGKIIVVAPTAMGAYAKNLLWRPSATAPRHHVILSFSHQTIL